MGLHWQFGVVQGAAGAAALSLSLNNTSDTINMEFSATDPTQAQVIDTSAGAVDTTATAAGGDGSYTFAWTITEDADAPNTGGSSSAVLAAGTQNVAQYDDITFRVNQGQIIDPSNGRPTGNPPFQQSIYTLQCTVTDGESSTATADYIVTFAAS